jgi:hypothetical protein
MKFPLIAVVAALLVSGCAGVSKLSVSSMAVSPPSLMVAKKSPRTLLLVVDPAKVPVEVPVLVGGEDRGGRITDVQQFVTRDLKKAFSTYFDNVVVAAPGQAVPPGPHAVADVKLERVEVIQTAHRTSGSMTYTAGAAALTWGIGLRLSESDEYLYSFAGESVGTPSESPDFVFRTMFESAITDMLKGYTDKGVHARLLEAPAPEKKDATRI